MNNNDNSNNNKFNSLTFIQSTNLLRTHNKNEKAITQFKQISFHTKKINLLDLDQRASEPIVDATNEF